MIHDRCVEGPLYQKIQKLIDNLVKADEEAQVSKMELIVFSLLSQKEICRCRLNDARFLIEEGGRGES